MKFSDLEKLSDAIRDKLKCYISVSVCRNSFAHTGSETVYSLYTEAPRKIDYFSTLQEVRAYMEYILNPLADEGITFDELNEMAEDGILRGAE